VTTPVADVSVFDTGRIALVDTGGHRSEKSRLGQGKAIRRRVA